MSLKYLPSAETLKTVAKTLKALVFGTVVPITGLWMVYTNLNTIYHGLGGVVVGVCLVAFGYFSTTPEKSKKA